MNKKFALIAMMLTQSLHAQESTFVGNGGNAGDLDLSITLAQIEDSFENISSDYESLCKCADDVANNELCEVLRKLSPDQAKVCAEIMLESKSAMRALASKSSKIKFVWSDKPFKAQAKDGSKRPVDAVTQNAKNRITINRPRFLAMPQSYRIALITHELFHLARVRGNLLTDEQDFVPFKNGGHLLDTLGAATAVAADDYGVIADFDSLRHVSRAYKRFLVQFARTSTRHHAEFYDRLFKSKNGGGYALNIQYKVGGLLTRAGTDATITTSTSIPGLTSHEALYLYSVGLGYQWFPITARLSRWSETHISTFAEAVIGSAGYRISDEAMSLRDSSPVHGAQLTAQLTVPFAHDFWGTLGYQLKHVSYEYKKLGIKVEELQKNILIGGAYGF